MTSPALPWFALKRPCADCPFRRDVPPYLSDPERIVQALDEARPFFCHKSTTTKMRPVTHADARFCAGSLLHLTHRREPAVHMRLAVALGAWHPDELHTDVAVFRTRAAFVAHHKGPSCER